MTAEEYEKDVLPGFIKALSQAFLDAEEKYPGGMKAWMESLAKGKGRQVGDTQAIPYEQHGAFPFDAENGLCMCYACLDLRRAYWAENR